MGIKKRIAMGKLKLPETKREGNTWTNPLTEQDRKRFRAAVAFPFPALVSVGAACLSPQIEKLRDMGHTESVIEQIMEYVNGESGVPVTGTQLRPEEAQPSGHDDVRET